MNYNRRHIILRLIKLPRQVFFMLLLGFIYLSNNSILLSKPKIEKTPRIEWRAISAASRYRVQITKSGSTIIDTKTASNFISAPLHHGVYKFKITAYNQKGETIGESGWEPLIIQSWSLVSKQYYYVGVGVGFEYITPSWNKINENGNSWNIYGGYDLPIQSIQLEAILDYQSFSPIYKEDKVSTEIDMYSLNCGVFYFSRLSDLFTAGVRLSPGLSYTTISIEDTEETKEYNSIGLSVILGIGLRFNMSYGFIEHGVEYKQTFLNGNDFMSVRPYLRGGARF
ncbi:MAG: outer membrane beta-barrel protein [Spirochaetes bacterium]|nr:outer membrane beta-barrel protein [Spirochaetota bacterium]MBN2770202.1 outer membrane beta-barrel protein [Spirochaetota bacterium]